MQSAQTSLRIHRQNEALKNAVTNTINKLCSNPTCKVRVSTRAAKSILMQYPTLMALGRLYSTQTKSIGAGVHEVSLAKT